MQNDERTLSRCEAISDSSCKALKASADSFFFCIFVSIKEEKKMGKYLRQATR